MSRPNLLLIMADQRAPQFLPCYGHPLVKAPTLERLAAEGVTTPQFMVRRGAGKLIHADGDPVQYYDLATDPDEVNNLAAEPAHEQAVAGLLAELETRYDRDALTATVRESQQRRRFLKTVMRTQGLAWDYQPREDVANAWVRNTMPVYELEKRGRFPRV